jgi:hypothetical protein
MGRFVIRSATPADAPALMALTDELPRASRHLHSSALLLITLTSVRREKSA